MTTSASFQEGVHELAQQQAWALTEEEDQGQGQGQGQGQVLEGLAALLHPDGDDAYAYDDDDDDDDDDDASDSMSASSSSSDSDSDESVVSDEVLNGPQYAAARAELMQGLLGEEINDVGWARQLLATHHQLAQSRGVRLRGPFDACMHFTDPAPWHAEGWEGGPVFLDTLEAPLVMWAVVLAAQRGQDPAYAGAHAEGGLLRLMIHEAYVVNLNQWCEIRLLGGGGQREFRLRLTPLSFLLCRGFFDRAHYPTNHGYFPRRPIDAAYFDGCDTENGALGCLRALLDWGAEPNGPMTVEVRRLRGDAAVFPWLQFVNEYTGVGGESPLAVVMDRPRYGLVFVRTLLQHILQTREVDHTAGLLAAGVRLRDPVAVIHLLHTHKRALSEQARTWCHGRHGNALHILVGIWRLSLEPGLFEELVERLGDMGLSPRMESLQGQTPMEVGEEALRRQSWVEGDERDERLAWMIGHLQQVADAETEAEDAEWRHKGVVMHRALGEHFGLSLEVQQMVANLVGEDEDHEAVSMVAAQRATRAVKHLH